MYPHLMRHAVAAEAAATIADSSPSVSPAGNTKSILRKKDPAASQPAHWTAARHRHRPPWHQAHSLSCRRTLRYSTSLQLPSRSPKSLSAGQRGYCFASYTVGLVQDIRTAESCPPRMLVATRSAAAQRSARFNFGAVASPSPDVKVCGLHGRPSGTERGWRGLLGRPVFVLGAGDRWSALAASLTNGVQSVD